MKKIMAMRDIVREMARQVVNGNLSAEELPSLPADWSELLREAHEETARLVRLPQARHAPVKETGGAEIDTEGTPFTEPMHLQEFHALIQDRYRELVPTSEDFGTADKVTRSNLALTRHLGGLSSLLLARPLDAATLQDRLLPSLGDLLATLTSICVHINVPLEAVAQAWLRRPQPSGSVQEVPQEEGAEQG